MYNINHTEEFNLSVALFVDVFKQQDKALVESCQKTFNALFCAEYTTDLMTAAVFQLAATDLDACHWTLQNLYDLDACLNLIEGTIKFAVQKLIDLGLILGKDFSASSNGEILITQVAKVALLESVADVDRLFIEEILQIVD